MKSLAPEDGIALNGSTARLVAAEFDVESMGSFDVKGVSEPQPAFLLRGRLLTQLGLVPAPGAAPSS